ncbi:MAG: hypothetical protein SFV22_20325 [Saprospiraceae bacterium]|nr:hypothetical protein [Saprospiraceae bacterium]
MKLPLFLLFAVGLLFSSFSLENPVADEIVVTGLRFNKTRIEALKKTPVQPAFIIDEKNILRPTQAYKILYVKSDKALVLIPSATAYSTFKQLSGYEELELPGGILIGCMCNELNDDCRFDNSKIETRFDCKGNCGCYIGIVFDLNPGPIQYETAPGGPWYNL